MIGSSTCQRRGDEHQHGAHGRRCTRYGFEPFQEPSAGAEKFSTVAGEVGIEHGVVAAVVLQLVRLGLSGPSRLGGAGRIHDRFRHRLAPRPGGSRGRGLEVGLVGAFALDALEFGVEAAGWRAAPCGSPLRAMAAFVHASTMRSEWRAVETRCETSDGGLAAAAGACSSDEDVFLGFGVYRREAVVQDQNRRSGGSGRAPTLRAASGLQIA